MYFDGSDVGLTTSNEDVDGLAYVEESGVAKLLISTNAAFSVPGVSGGGEDLIRFTPTSLGEHRRDLVDVLRRQRRGPRGNQRKRRRARLLEGKLHLTTAGDFNVPGVAGGDEDVFVFTPATLGTNTSGSYDPTLFFDASGSNDIWGLDVRQVTGGGASLALLSDGGAMRLTSSSHNGSDTRALTPAISDAPPASGDLLSRAAAAAHGLGSPLPAARHPSHKAFALYDPADLWFGA